MYNIIHLDAQGIQRTMVVDYVVVAQAVHDSLEAVGICPNGLYQMLTERPH